MSDDDTAKIDDNMRIWDQVCEVPAEFCKSFLPNGETDPKNSLTSVTPMYYFRQATEMWGPIGLGWGFEIKSSDFVTNGKGEAVMHVVTVKLWYGGRMIITRGEAGRPDTQEGAVPGTYVYGVGCTPLQYTDDAGRQRWDDDFNKKTLTDAITNALSRLGFGAEIRLANREGDKYLRRSSGSGDKDGCLEAWNEFVQFMRKEHPDRVKDQTDDQMMATATKRLTDNQRRVTPEEIRKLMGK
jgi:hypothetical protein